MAPFVDEPEEELEVLDVDHRQRLHSSPAQLGRQLGVDAVPEQLGVHQLAAGDHDRPDSFDVGHVDVRDRRLAGAGRTVVPGIVEFSLELHDVARLERRVEYAHSGNSVNAIAAELAAIVHYEQEQVAVSRHT